jgi:hypothetical protein
VTPSKLAEHCNAECRFCLVSLMLSVTCKFFMLSVVVLNVLSVIMLSVVAPPKGMVQLQLTGQNLGRVLISRLGRAFVCHAIALITKTG